MALGLIGVFLTGCGPVERPVVETIVEETPAPMPNLDHLVGTDYTGLSRNFDVTVFPSVLFENADGWHLPVRYAVTNKSPARFDGFSANLALNPEFDKYLAGGTALVPMTEFDIVPASLATAGSEVGEQVGHKGDDGLARGVELRQNLAVYMPQELAESDVDSSGILDLGADTALVLTWDGGEETVYVDLEIQDPDNLLGAN
ncbi:hypothetical protein V5R04_10925 [Jonesiaceae bacterium BS-20]|uniref:Lipoprotein n=1 Tax=Jonesiaceae bacterium BS-20 TaxID=3120821 RepID=A0AAU7DRA3_9MICO